MLNATTMDGEVPRVRRARLIRTRAKVQVNMDTIDAEVERLAAHGLSLFVAERIAPAQSCAIRLNVFRDGAARPLRATGEVVSCSLSGMNGYRVALRFTDIDAESAQSLQVLLR